MAKFNILKAFGFNPSKKSVEGVFKTSTNMFTTQQSNVFNNNPNYIAQYKNWVYACVTARSQDVANISLQLYKGDEILDTHPLLDLLSKVNPTMTKHNLFNATQSYLDLDGNAFWFLARAGNDNTSIKTLPVEIYLVRPDRVTIVVDKTNPIVVSGYVYTTKDGTKIPFAPDEIIHFKNFNPNNEYPFVNGKGMGIVQAAYAAVYTDNEMRNFNASFFKNSARPDGMLIPDGDSAMSSEEYERLKTEWNEEHKGSDNAHKTAIMTGGLKWQEIARSQTDMQFLDQLTFNRDEILSLFRVPKIIVGVMEGVNKASAEAAIYVYSLKTIKPLMQSMVDTINEFLLPYFGDDTLRLDFLSPVQEDKDTQLAGFVAGIDKWYSRNEIRAELGLLPTENGDKLMGLLNQVVIDETIPAPAKKQISKPIVKTAGSELVDKFVAKLPKSKSYKHIQGLAKSNYILNWKNHLDSMEGPLKKKLIPYFEKQEKEVMSNLKSEYAGLEAKEFKIKGLTDILFIKEKAVKTAISLITPFIQEYIDKSGGQATTIAGGTHFDSDTEKIIDFKATRAKYFAETINETTTNRLLDSIQEGIDSAESYDQISQRVSDIYDIAKGSRTDTIARTEVSAASNFGATQAYLQAGATKHEWVVVDPKDEDCLENEGEVVEIGEPFESGDTDAPVHPNCQCGTLPVFDDN